MRQYSGMSPDDIPSSALRLWNEHQQAEFPHRLREQEVAGVDMVMLDADVAGCIGTWASVGQLDQPHREGLEQCLTDLNRVLPLLNDQSEKAYYERLRELATLALR